ncbi:MAG: cytochrome c [Gammaproteobacteria bacterium]|nr:cytochrome c [Gammaproteobacteria bacterium]
MKSLKVIVIAVLVSVLGVNIAIARHHGSGDMRNFVSRDGLMHLISDQRGIIRAMAEGEAPDNEAEFIRAANALSALFALVPSAFEKNAMVDISRSKPEIWQNWDDFVSVANTQSLVASGIAQTAMTQGLDAAKAKVGDLDCGSCHDPYRTEDE